MNKKIKKKIDKRCYFCSEDKYELLDVHRIIPGEQGGKYTEWNTVTACANCHRKCHAGVIVIDRWYKTSSGVMLHYFEEGVEIYK